MKALLPLSSMLVLGAVLGVTGCDAALDLVDPGVIVRVADEETGEPLCGMTVFAHAGGRVRELKEIPDEEGTCSYEGLDAEPGIWAVSAHGRGYLTEDQEIAVDGFEPVGVTLSAFEEAAALGLH